MARIAGVNLPVQKRVDIGLTYIYGIGRVTAKKILAETGRPPEVRVKDLTEAQANALRDAVEKGRHVEGELRREVLGNIKRLKDMAHTAVPATTRDCRHAGQRSKTNSRTVRGNVRKTMGSGKRKLDKK